MSDKSGKPQDSFSHRFRKEIYKLLGVLSALIFMMMWLSGAFVSKVEPGAPVAKPPPPKVSTEKVQRRTFPLISDQVGTLRARTEADVSARIMAQVREILVKEGDRVLGRDDKGTTATVMARLEDGDIQARLRQAQAQITAAERAMEASKAKLGSARAQLEAARATRDKVTSDYRRYQDLFRNQAATGQQLDHARAQKDVAEAQVSAATQDVHAAGSEIERIQAQKEQTEAAAAEARVALSFTVIKAPFSGKVVKKMVDVGDMASPGKPLFFLETPSHPELHAYISESLLLDVKVGERLDVHIDALDRTFPGELREIVPKSDPSTRTVLVKVGLSPDLELVNGLFGRLLVPHGSYESLVVPARAVRTVGQLELAEVVDPDGYAQRRFITLGERHGELVEVLTGLKENEEVVVP